MRADGSVIADSWLRPEDLVSLGQSMAISDDAAEAADEAGE